MKKNTVPKVYVYEKVLRIQNYREENTEQIVTIYMATSKYNFVPYCSAKV